MCVDPFLQNNANGNTSKKNELKSKMNKMKQKLDLSPRVEGKKVVRPQLSVNV
jgi:hypothetical protein